MQHPSVGLVRARLLWLARLVLVLPAGAAGKSPQDVFKQVSPSIVIVQALDASGSVKATGSGIVISRGQVLTNCHVAFVGSALLIRARTRTFAATVRFADRERDLCQLSAPTLSAPPATLGDVADLSPGARVVAIGAPEGLELSISEGLVSGFRRAGAGSPLIQTTAAISPGSSGGGLFDEAGKLVGITTFFLKDGQNLNFAVPINWLKELQLGRPEDPHPERASEANVDEPATSLEESAADNTPAGRDAAAAAATEQLRALGADLRSRDRDFPGKMFLITPYINQVAEKEPPSNWAKLVESKYRTFSQREVEAGWLGAAKNLESEKQWNELQKLAWLWTSAHPKSSAAWLHLVNPKIT